MLWSQTLPFIVALLLGGLIGLERERVHKKRKIVHVAGIRTFALVSLFGASIFSLEQASVLLAAGLLLGMIIMLAGNFIAGTLKHGVSGATTEVSLFLTLIIGYFCGLQQYSLASLLTCLTVAVLLFKTTIHLFVEKISNKELRSIIVLTIISAVILPILPNEFMGPLQAINPFQAWLMVVLISAISFMSYILIRILGPKRGLFVSGFLGGLISSTAVTLSFAALSRKMPKQKWNLICGIVFASAAMFARVFLEVSVVNAQLSPFIAKALLSSSLVGILLGVYYARRSRKTKMLKASALEQNISPLEFKKALGFGLAFLFVTIVMKVVNLQFGDLGIYATSFLSGLIDTDAIALSLAQLAKNTIDIKIAATGVIIAAYANTLVKLGYIFFLGDRALAKSFSYLCFIMIASGLAWFL